MNQVPPPPPQHSGPPRNGGQPRPPPQHFPQGQQQPFPGPPPQFPQQQPPQFQQPRPIINDLRYDQDRPINGVATIHSILPQRVTTEKDIRKQLTTYESWSVAPTVDEDSKKETGNNKRSLIGKNKKNDKKKETWTKAMQIQEFLSPADIAKAIKRLDDKQDVSRRMADLGPNQRAQISHILDKKLLTDRDMQYSWEVAQLERTFVADKNGDKKKTKSITVYLKRSPKPDVDCMELMRRKEQQRAQQAQNAEHQRQMQAMQQQQAMQAQAQQQQFRPPMGPIPGAQGQFRGPMNGGGRGGPPPMNGGVRGGPPPMRGGGPPAGVRVVEVESSSDSSSASSGSGSDSDSDADSATTPGSVSTRRSSRRNRRDKEYYGRGTSRNRSSSRSRPRNKDFLVVDNGRRRGSRGPGLPYAPESPRAGSRPPFGRSNTYGGRPTVVTQGPRQSHDDFFAINHQSLRNQPRPIVHQSHRETSSLNAGIDAEVIADIMGKALELGLKAGRQETTTSGALALQRQAPLPRPPLAVSDYLDRRARTFEEQAEAQFRQDEVAARYQAGRVRDSRSPLGGPAYDFERIPSRQRFHPADLYDSFPPVPMSPSSSGSSASLAGRRGRDGFSSRGSEYGHRRGEGVRFDSDLDDWEMVGRDGRDEGFSGRDDRNPFQSRRSSSRIPPPLRRSSFSRSDTPHDYGRASRW